MDPTERRSRLERALAGYANGPEAIRAERDAALARARDARLVILVEGISDLMALEAVAELLDRDLRNEQVVVAPVGGAQAIGKYLGELRPPVDVRVLVDEAEADAVLRVVKRQRVDPVGGLVEVCVEDLEDELIRAIGPCMVERIIEREGDLGSFRSLQRQPVWRQGDLTAQLRRFFGAGARRKLRYARLLALELHPDRIPAPIDRVLRV